MVAWFRLPSGATANDYNFIQISDNSASGGYHRLSNHATAAVVLGFISGDNFPHTSGLATTLDDEWHMILCTTRVTGGTWTTDVTVDRDTPTALAKAPNAGEFDRMSIGYEGDLSPADEMIGSVAHVAFGRTYLNANRILDLAAGRNVLDVVGSGVDHYWPMTRETIKGHLNFDVVGGRTLRLTQADNTSSTANLFDFRGSKPCPVRAPSLVIRRPAGFVAAAPPASTHPGWSQSRGGWF
jgi:hypothetical protein